MSKHKSERMSSRERLLAALDHKEPDRVPIDLGGNQTGIHRLAYESLIGRLGLKEPIEIMDAVQQLARPSEAVLERLRVDTRYVFAGSAEGYDGRITRVERDGRAWFDLTDEFGVRWSMPEDQPLYMDISCSPLAGRSMKEMEEYQFPRGDDPARFGKLREQAREIRNHSPYAVVSGISGVVYEYCWYLRGLENWFIDMIEDPDFCAALLDKTLKFWMDWFKAFLDECADVVDVIMIGDDLSAQSGPLFSPKFYRRVVKPRHRQLAQYIRSRTSAKLWYHTCGSCREYLPDLIDNGVQVINPVQISAKNMEPEGLKRDFGAKLSFWGGAVDSQHSLPKNSPDEIREEVKANLARFMPGGGYVFNNVHNIQAGVPPENILAMYDAAYEFGFYD